MKIHLQSVPRLSRLLSLLLVSFLFTSGIAPALAVGEPAVKPVIVSGTVPDEGTRQAILARVREVYGAERVIDQLGVGNVVAPANWSSYVQKLITPDLKQVSGGALAIQGNNLSVHGEVANEAQRQQIVSDFATRLNPTYVVKNGLRVGAGQQQLLDKTLANRIVEFESGSSKLAPMGMQILDEMLAVIGRLGKQKVMIIGHTDSQGHPDANRLLSQSRAESVQRYLVARGIEPERLQSTGLGANEPVATNATPEGRARNRRIEFRIVD